MLIWSYMFMVEVGPLQSLLPGIWYLFWSQQAWLPGRRDEHEKEYATQTSSTRWTGKPLKMNPCLSLITSIFLPQCDLQKYCTISQNSVCTMPRNWGSKQRDEVWKPRELHFSSCTNEMENLEEPSALKPPVTTRMTQLRLTMCWSWSSSLDFYHYSSSASLPACPHQPFAPLSPVKLYLAIIVHCIFKL